MRKVWILVANSSQAKIFRAEEGSQVLVVHGVFFHDDSRLMNHDLVSDGSGRESVSMMSGSDTYDPKTSPKMKEAHLFANELADFLQKGLNKGEYERVYIVAKPPFLGYLRQSMTPNVAKTVVSEIHKDLPLATSEEIREYLPPLL